MGSPPRDKTRAEAPPLPRLESTYSVILQRAIAAAKQRTGLTQRLRSATRELAALVPHARAHFRGMPLGGKIATVVVLLTIGATLALAATYFLGRPSPERLRARVQARLTAGDFIGAKDVLTELRQTSALTDADRWQLVAPVEAGMLKLRQRLQRQIERQREAAHWDEALGTLDEMERAGFAGDWMLFTRAELLRLSGRAEAARPYYVRYRELYPSTEQADDALFWEAAIRKEAGDRAVAKQLLRQLLAQYPGTNFKSSARRLLAELE